MIYREYIYKFIELATVAVSIYIFIQTVCLRYLFSREFFVDDR